MPQIYYVGLLAGANDHAAVERTGEGRAINRHDYALDEIEAALRRPIVQQVLDLVRLRNTHPVFEGDVRIEAGGATSIGLRWEHDGRCLDLALGQAQLSDDETTRTIAEWQP